MCTFGSCVCTLVYMSFVAQRHEIEAWVNPDAWDDRKEAERVIDAIEASGSNDEADWVRIAGGDTGDILAGASRDVDRADQRDYTTELEQAGSERHDALSRLRDLAVEAVEAGVPKVDVATAAGVSRVTLDRWIQAAQ